EGFQVGGEVDLDWETGWDAVHVEQRPRDRAEELAQLDQRWVDREVLFRVDLEELLPAAAHDHHAVHLPVAVPRAEFGAGTSLDDGLAVLGDDVEVLAERQQD